MTRESDFALNLRFLCAEERSVSEVCRQVGINRQQFARYLGATARPSPHNLRRISQYFGLSESRLRLPHEEFLDWHDAAREGSERQAEVLVSAFRGVVRQMRPLVGYYHGHYSSPSSPERIVRALIQVAETDGLFYSRTVERDRDPVTGLVSRARYSGLVALHDGAVFLVERGRNLHGGIAETVLQPAHRGTRDWLFGLTLGFSWRTRKPFASRCIWKRLRARTSLREALARCGSFPARSRELDPLVVEHMRKAQTAEALAPMTFPGQEV
ncbi:MAG: XRE family transcriptional regulator [Pseudomonadota bacterium]